MEEEIKINPIKKCSDCGFYYKTLDNGKKRHISRPWKDEYNQIIWKNFILPDIRTVILVFMIVTMVVSYKIDIAHYRNVIEHPKEFCCKALASPSGFLYGNECMDKQNITNTLILNLD